MSLLPTSSTLKENSFSCHYLNPFTFEVVYDMCHLTPEGVYALQSSLFFLCCQSQNKTIHTFPLTMLSIRWMN